ncbi:translation elongation factor Ts [Alphaproteobacteria bacterium]|nr:translation elongation factor Ts [Alphaproteobacteria bacterium]
MSDLMEGIKNLREITGAGFLDCKKALEANNHDIDLSIDFLRKKGLAKANKKSSREAKEGAIGVYFNNKISTIIQINTETDFAAKNEVFLNFMDKIGNFSLEIKDKNYSFKNFLDSTHDGRIISDYFKDIIAKIGENIVLTKLYINEHKQNYFSYYVHNSYKKNIGKLATFISYKADKDNDESKLLAKNICMHIAASKPLSLNVANLNKDLIEKEKDIQLDLIKSSGKPENIVEKILEGKMKKFYSESTLLNQNYILDPDQTVEKVVNEFSKKNNFEILSYNLVSLET